MDEPSQDLVIVPQISLEKVWDRVLEVDQGRDCIDAVGLGLLGVVDFDLNNVDQVQLAYYVSRI